MKFSEKWLREWVNPAIDSDELAEQLTMAGLEVDSMQSAGGEFSGVVVAEITAVELHPSADKLKICQLSIGEKELLQVVCGAANARVGLKAPFAKVNAFLPDNFKIKKAKLRGVESFGMLCSEAELQLSDNSDGLMELAVDASIGEDIREYLQLNDTLIEVDLTPNRGDCLGIEGIARDVAVLNELQLRGPEINEIPAVIEACFPVAIEAPQQCPRYVGRVIRDVNIKVASPLWLVEKLRRSDIRSIDPVVDVTNYVMLELGQPMHAFDLDQLKGGICVRMAQRDEKLILLNGQELSLQDDTLLITDESGPLAMAGIMGGENSGVSDATRHIFLESAFFNPLVIAGKARSYGLHTDSSHRFERGVDYQLQRRAVERATALLLDIVGGKPGPVTEVVVEAHLPADREVILKPERIEKNLGMKIDADKVEGIFCRLGLKLIETPAVNGQWRLKVPSHRFDISLEADLIEELARIYGYNRLPATIPVAALPFHSQQEAHISLTKIRTQLVARGYQEAITYSFIEPELQQLLDSGNNALKLANPISSDMSVMRTTLWPGLLKTLEYNQNRQKNRVRLFETGLCFVNNNNGLQQKPHIGGVICGSRYPEGWSSSQEALGFYDVKGDVESILALGRDLSAYKFLPGKHEALHPGQCARIEHQKEFVGYVGALHPSIQRQMGLNGPVYLFELLLPTLQKALLPKFDALSKFPEVRRDLAINIQETVAATEIQELVKTTVDELLKEIVIFDVYQGKGIEEGKKSIALGLIWQHPERTLNDEEINSAVDQVVAALQEKFNATLR